MFNDTIERIDNDTDYNSEKVEEKIENKTVVSEKTLQDNDNNNNSGNRLLDGNNVGVDIVPTTKGNNVYVSFCSCIFSYKHVESNDN